MRNEDFTFGHLACVKSPFDLTIDFEKDLANPEIYDGLKRCHCNECGQESFYTIEEIRRIDCIDFSLLQKLCGTCAFDICGFEWVN